MLISFSYNWMKSDDGVGGREGAFSMVSFWLIEALTRAAKYEKKYLPMAVNMFESMLGMSQQSANRSDGRRGCCVPARGHRRDCLTVETVEQSYVFVVVVHRGAS